MSKYQGIFSSKLSIIVTQNVIKFISSDNILLVPLENMSISFNKDDVHKHLLDLGYTNITGDQLQEFMKDLKRLIRYEEKQKRIEAHLNVTKGTSPKSPLNENRGK